MTQPTIIDRSRQDALDWIRNVGAMLDTQDDDGAYAALRASLHTLRDRLPAEEAAHLADQMPTLVRGIFFESWSPGRGPEKSRTEEDFVSSVRERLHDHPEIDADLAARGTLALLAEKLTPGVIDHAIATMPDSMRGLWPEASVRHAAGV